MQRFLDAPNVSTIGVTYTTTELYAEMYSRLREAGRPIGTNDLWIAAVTLEHDACLLTLDSDFAVVPDLILAKL